MKNIIIISILFSTTLFSKEVVNKKSTLLKLNNIEKCVILARDNRELSLCENKLIGWAKSLELIHKKNNIGHPEIR